MKLWKGASVAAAVLAVLIGLALAFAPILYAEAFMGPAWLRQLTAPPSQAGYDARPGPAAGTVAEGYWRVQQIAPATWAIGEPQNDPDNYEYLLVGKTRALLIDAGSTTRDMRPVLAGLTSLPVTVIPTHLHFDHTNGLRHFADVALIDLPQTRASFHEGRFHLSRYQFMHLGQAGGPPVFPVTKWVKPDGVIDLGGRQVQVLSTPGHTATSVSIHDPAAKLLFTGDLIYTTTLYAFMPDSSLSAYVSTADRLLATIPADTTIYGAHCCRNDAPAQAPWMKMNDLRDVRQAAADIQSGKGRGRGLIIRRFPVNSRMTLLTLYPFGNR
ncbi:MBL fold metallo-hydrolase [Phenylobacterium sp.]|jgi:hydroxyacylglutathione hydrolase|uniref:MBL fold metallo-hydrolase n=1 Tax=Phenylobacterium sp. TaxID=1871053 RepID=UPI001215E613|nr:MBL fold metallo-hydrolase [Phenylobacterium sp.]THD57953.1 MAG: MBL fold metallo-hydrolase [Phenylobacterium sp.]